MTLSEIAKVYKPSKNFHCFLVFFKRKMLSGPSLYFAICLPILAMLFLFWILYCLINNGCLQSLYFRPCIKLRHRCCMNKLKLQEYCCGLQYVNNSNNRLSTFCRCGYGCCPQTKQPDIAADRDTKIILDRFESLQKGTKSPPVTISQPSSNKKISFVEKY